MLERALIALALLVLFTGAIWLGRRWYERRNARIEERLRASTPTTDERKEPSRTDNSSPASNSPRIVYFTTRSCLVCKTQQEPAIERLIEEVPEVVVEQYDAVEESALAKEYGVLLVPTTAVYDRTGALVAVNRGFAPAVRLRAQVDGETRSRRGTANGSADRER